MTDLASVLDPIKDSAYYAAKGRYELARDQEVLNCANAVPALIRALEAGEQHLPVTHVMGGGYARLTCSCGAGTENGGGRWLLMEFDYNAHRREAQLTAFHEETQ